MMVKIKKFKLLASFAFMTICMMPEAKAFPLLCADFGRLANTVQVTANEVMIIKQEIDNNMKIIKEIQNGGFAAAGAMIFSNIQSDELDRFGNMWSDAKSQIDGLSQDVQDRLKQYEDEFNTRYGDEYERLKSAKDELYDTAKTFGLEEELRKREEEALSLRGNNAFENAYNWLQENKAATPSGFIEDTINNGVNNLNETINNTANDAFNDAFGGDWGNIEDSISEVENAINNTNSDELNSILNDAANGNWDGVLNSTMGNTGGEAGQQGAQRSCEECRKVAQKAAEEAARVAGKVGLSISELSIIDKQCRSVCSSGS